MYIIWVNINIIHFFLYKKNAATQHLASKTYELKLKFRIHTCNFKTFAERRFISDSLLQSKGFHICFFFLSVNV